jgi:hypothetical protein
MPTPIKLGKSPTNLFQSGKPKALQVLGVFLVSSHACREVLSITMSKFPPTWDEMKHPRKSFSYEMNAWSLKGFRHA